MKKIINGKMYNTETAMEIDSYSNDYGYDDFDYVSETLYIKKTGEFFLLGDGSARSIYSKSCGNNSRIGCKLIIPLSEEEAKEWILENCKTDTYIKLFGEVEE